MISQRSAAAIGLAQTLQRERSFRHPRQAVVVANNGLLVDVRFIDESPTAPVSQYVSTHSPLPVGTTGVVVPTRGGGEYFEPFSLPSSPIGETFITSTGSNPSASSTTVITTTYPNMVIIQSLVLSDLIPEATEGVWDVTCIASGTFYRSITTGGVYLAVGDAASGNSSVALGRFYPQTGGAGLTTSRTFENVAHNFPFDIRYAGFSAAGTTYLVTHSATIIATRRS